MTAPAKKQGGPSGPSLSPLFARPRAAGFELRQDEHGAWLVRPKHSDAGWHPLRAVFSEAKDAAP